MDGNDKRPAPVTCRTRSAHGRFAGDLHVYGSPEEDVYPAWSVDDAVDLRVRSDAGV
jgi:hypothetical protein